LAKPFVELAQLSDNRLLVARLLYDKCLLAVREEDKQSASAFARAAILSNWPETAQVMSCVYAVLPLSMVDNSVLSPNRLTIPINPAYPSF
jgi:hypothetical protein